MEMGRRLRTVPLASAREWTHALGHIGCATEEKRVMMDEQEKEL
jgi:hypothetical protein